jgi:hypothetical protein
VLRDERVKIACSLAIVGVSIPVYDSIPHLVGRLNIGEEFIFGYFCRRY